MKSLLLVLWTVISCTHAQAPPVRTAPIYDADIDNGVKGLYPTHEYKTFKGDVKVPLVNFKRWSPECDDGSYYFLTPRGASTNDKPGPMILDSRGELIWAHHDKNFVGSQAYNLMVQKYKGEDHLTYWMGEDRVKGHGAGYFYILDSSYHEVKAFGGASGLWTDLHEGLITDDNTVLLTMYDIVTHDVSMYKNSSLNEWKDSKLNQVWDCVIQEMDLRTLALKWQWRATEHVNVNDTYHTLNNDGTKDNPWDWYHINSVQKDELGNYLISARFPHSIAYIDGRTKNTIWTLGGKRNDFMDLSYGNATNFAWQHHARFHSTNTFPKLYTPPPARLGFTTKLLTLFDNAAENEHYTYGLPLSRGLLLELTYPTPSNRKAPPTSPGKRGAIRQRMIELDIEKTAESINGSNPDYTARVIMSYDNPDNIRSSSQGSMQLIPQTLGKDPNVLIGYGLDAAWTEFTSNGSVLCDAHFGATTSFETGEIQSYRVFKFPWSGRPKHSPAVVVDSGVAYFSWLGATDIAEWVVQTSATMTGDDKAWRDVFRVPKTKFEGNVTISKEAGSARYLRVLALNQKGERMEYGISDAVDRGVIAAYFHNKPLNIFGVAVCVVSALLVVYEVCRRHFGLEMRLWVARFFSRRRKDSITYELLVDS